MSQHTIDLETPQGTVLVTAGYDQTLDEAFVNCCGGDTDLEFMSGPGLRVDDIQKVILEQLQVRLPQQMIDAIHADVASMRLGENINRRVTHYTTQGEVIARA